MKSGAAAPRLWRTERKSRLYAVVAETAKRRRLGVAGLRMLREAIVVIVRMPLLRMLAAFTDFGHLASPSPVAFGRSSFGVSAAALVRSWLLAGRPTRRRQSRLGPSVPLALSYQVNSRCAVRATGNFARPLFGVSLKLFALAFARCGRVRHAGT